MAKYKKSCAAIEDIWNVVKNTWVTPQKWADEIGVPIYKKGDPQVTKGWRPISLKISMANVMLKALDMRMRGLIFGEPWTWNRSGDGNRDDSGWHMRTVNVGEPRAP
jgi:hypothetical protein